MKPRPPGAAFNGDPYLPRPLPMDTKTRLPISARGFAVVVMSALLLPAGAGCDSSDDSLQLDAAFMVGVWTLDGVRDGSGDRTDDVRAVVEDFRATFSADNTFTLVVEYTAATGEPDQTIAGTYAISQGGLLVLTSGEQAISFAATIQDQITLELRAPAILVEGIIAGTEIDIGLTGMVELTLVRATGAA